MGGAVRSLEWLVKTRLRQGLCITSVKLGPSTGPLNRWAEEGLLLMIPIVWFNHTVVDVQTSMISYLCYKYKQDEVWFKKKGWDLGNFYFLKAPSWATLTLTFHTTFIWTVASLGINKLNLTGIPSGCDKIATVQIQRYKRGLKVHIYKLYTEHSWANSHGSIKKET